MSRTISPIRSPWSRAIAGLLAPPVTASLAAGLLAAGVPVAHAQDAGVATAASANQSSPAPNSAGPGQPAGGQTDVAQTGGARAGASQQSDGAANSASPAQSDKPPVVCFKLTGRCVEQKQGPATKGGASAAQAGSTAKRPLNLAAPDVRTVVPAEELKEPLPTNDQIAEVQESATVQVKTDEGVPPDVPGGFGALWWAVNHPSQAWRILAPAE